MVFSLTFDHEQERTEQTESLIVGCQWSVLATVFYTLFSLLSPVEFGKAFKGLSASARKAAINRTELIPFYFCRIADMEDASQYGAIWDMDGTLVDTAELHFAAWSAVAKELNQPFSRADFTATFGKRNPEILRQLYGNRFSDKEIAELGDRKEEYYRAAARRQGVQPLPGVKALIESLRQAGFKQAIGSSAPRANLDLILSLTKLGPYFETLVSMEDTQRGKPDPQVFLVAAERLRVSPSHCVVIEDAVAGVQAAKAGGMKCIAVDFVGHHGQAALQSAGADLVVKTLEEVNEDSVRRLLD
jgi:beta-phosphoglucomutase